MQKIMFDDNFGLTGATYLGRKTMTRRFAKKVMVKDENGRLYWNGKFKKPRYKVGEIVAVAQKYKDMMPYLADSFRQPSPNYMMDKPGYNNKMFVRADLMPTRILITAWRRERIQEISDEDCLREGVQESNVPGQYFVAGLQRPNHNDGILQTFFTPREAFSALVKKMSGKRAWDDNPYVDVYEYEIVK